MKILVAGSRHWTDRDLIHQTLLPFAGAKIVHGGNGYYVYDPTVPGARRAVRGADAIAGEIGLSLGCHVIVYEAVWKVFGPSAGPRRNTLMIVEEHKLTEPIDQAILFHEDIEHSRGTKDMRVKLDRAGIPHLLITGQRSQ